MRGKGFASLSPERRRELASQGGKAAQATGRTHRYTSETARQAGRKGGLAVVAKFGPEHMSEIGRSGGRVVSSDRRHMQEIGRKGGRMVHNGPDTERTPDTAQYVDDTGV